MEPWHTTAHWIAALLSLAGLLGLIARRRLRRCVTFAAYLGAVGTQGLRLALGREAPSWPAWLLVELVLRALSVLVALEIAARLFATLPEPARNARRAIIGVIVVTAMLLLIDLPTPSHPTFARPTASDVVAFDAAQRWLPRLAYGSAWLFAALFGLATRAALPLDPLHRLVLGGFGAYLLLYAVSLGTLPAIAAQARAISIALTAMYQILLLVWCYGAWRQEPTPDAPPDVVRRLWSWR